MISQSGGRSQPPCAGLWRRRSAGAPASGLPRTGLRSCSTTAPAPGYGHGGRQPARYRCLPSAFATPTCLRERPLPTGHRSATRAERNAAEDRAAEKDRDESAPVLRIDSTQSWRSLRKSILTTLWFRCFSFHPSVSALLISASGLLHAILEPAQ